MSNRIGVILGTQRAGTTALGRAIGSVPGVCHLGEVFHGVRGPHDDPGYQKFLTDPDANFFSFRERLLMRFPSLSYPSDRNQATIWGLYRSHLLALYPGDLCVLNIKYNSMHHLNPVWHDALKRPGLLGLLDQVPILHIVRGDLFAQAVSASIAAKAQKWHSTDSEAPWDMSPVQLNPASLADLMLGSLHSQKAMSRFLSHYKNSCEIVYETAFQDGRLTADACNHIRDLFALKGGFTGATDLRKVITVPLDQLILNAAEVRAHFVGHELETHVAAHLH